MNNDTWHRLDAEFSEFPILRAEAVAGDEVDAASTALHKQFPPDYRAFVERYGGAVVGAFPIFGLRQAEPMSNTMWSVVDVNKWFRDQAWPGVADWLVISMDQSGNPIGIANDGRVWVSDHDYGSLELLADTFEGFLRHQCLKVED